MRALRSSELHASFPPILSMLALAALGACSSTAADGPRAVSTSEELVASTSQAYTTTSNVVTQHNDTYRTGQYPFETKLNASTVQAGKFGKVFTRNVDGQLYAQPLYVRGITAGGQP